MRSVSVCYGRGLDPHYNLALEQVLLEHCPEDSCILYLWQNQNTVVIGRNQNPWRECRLEMLAREEGVLARRLSGGGAVFHDVGNLNFTFLTTVQGYDLDRQLSVIQRACQGLGIAVTRSGRNDILAQGRKFSGNAFYQSRGKAYHHGTLLVNTDFEKLQRYLSPSKAKLEAKGVASVRSRVINLRELVPSLTCEEMGSAMEAAFGEVYGLQPQVLLPEQLAGERLDALTAKNASWEWLYGTTLPFSVSCEGRLSCGELQVQLAVASGVITAAKVYTDAMDWQLPEQLEQALAGCPLATEAVAARLNAALGPGNPLAGELSALLADKL